MTTTELRAIATEEYRKAGECYARAYEAEAEADRLAGDLLSAEFHSLLAKIHRGDRSEETEQAKEQAYFRLQASRCLDGRFLGIPPEHLAAVKAEVDRMLKDSPAPAVTGTPNQPAGA